MGVEPTGRQSKELTGLSGWSVRKEELDPYYERAHAYCDLGGYRYDVTLVPDMSRVTPFLQKYMETMGWQDLNWLEDAHMGYEEGRPAVFDRNINGWVTIPPDIELPDNQQDRDMIARELLVKFQMSPSHPMVDLRKAYEKFA